MQMIQDLCEPSVSVLGKRSHSALSACDDMNDFSVDEAEFDFFGASEYGACDVMVGEPMGEPVDDLEVPCSNRSSVSSLFSNESGFFDSDADPQNNMDLFSDTVPVSPPQSPSEEMCVNGSPLISKTVVGTSSVPGSPMNTSCDVSSMKQYQYLQQYQQQLQQQQQLEQQQRERQQLEQQLQQRQQLEQQLQQQQQQQQQQQKQFQINKYQDQVDNAKVHKQEPPSPPQLSEINDEQINQEKQEQSVCSKMLPQVNWEAHDMYELRVVGEMATVWYADRPYPPFGIEIVDRRTQQPATDVQDYKISISVIDGYGNDASDKVYGQIYNHEFPLTAPSSDSPLSARITGLRFCAVSSKSGGFFRVILQAVHPTQANSIPALESEKIQVLSYRLYHAPKVAFDKLREDDCVGKMKGIGQLYAKRFAAIGVRTVGQLAALDVGTMGDMGAKRLLQSLRKDRGAMTMDKLEGYIQQARDIVARYHKDTVQHQNKRPRLSENLSGFPVPQFQAFSPEQASQPLCRVQHKVTVSPSQRCIRIQGVDLSALSAFAYNSPSARPLTCSVRLVQHS